MRVRQPPHPLPGALILLQSDSMETSCQWTPRRLRWLLLIVLTLALSLCAACGQTTLPSAAPPATPLPPAATPTGIPPAATLTADAAATLTVADIFADIHSMFATAATSNARADLTTISMEQTALARPTPAHRVFPTWPTSVPAPTPVVGPRPLEDCAPGIGGIFPTNCWIVRLDNEYLYLYGGYLYNVPAGDISDTSIGAIIVMNGTIGRYPTPQRLGPVHIVAVDGARVTLQTDNTQPIPVTFVFDLRTRQWVDPTTTQTPVATATLTRAQWDATKIAILDGTEHERQTRVASGTPFASTPIPLTQVEPITTPPMGISGGCADPSSIVTFSNCWNGKLNDEYIFAAVLVKKSDPAQGIIRVYTTTVGVSQFGPVGWYTTPSRGGLIEIMDATDYRLTLQAEDNSIYYFDVLTRQWVTPSPSPGPSPVPSALPPTP